MATLKVNGGSMTIDGPEDTTLLWALRDMAGLTGTKYGCGAGLCGACTVHVDGVAVKSCMTTVEEVAGKEVTTIEGLSPDGDHPVQVAWRDLHVPQCGFCQSGQIMQAASLLSEKPNPTDQEILDGMADNICRCGCYERIVAAVRQAATGS
ncbi:MAG: (2Fe-2S)-binding protein [Pseudomonadota bacterium]